MEIKITRADVLNASHYGSLSNCLLATAIKRQLETQDVVCGGTSVDIGEAEWYFKNFNSCDVDRLNDLVESTKGKGKQVLMTVTLF